MIELVTSPAGRRVSIRCDACSRSVDRAADAVLVPWASGTALVCHRGGCLDHLHRQYPSTAAEAVVELTAAVEQLVELLVEPADVEACT
jgi:hypothetical protein